MSENSTLLSQIKNNLKLDIFKDNKLRIFYIDIALDCIEADSVKVNRRKMSAKYKEFSDPITERNVRTFISKLEKNGLINQFKIGKDVFLRLEIIIGSVPMSALTSVPTKNGQSPIIIGDYKNDAKKSVPTANPTSVPTKNGQSSMIIGDCKNNADESVPTINPISVPTQPKTIEETYTEHQRPKKARRIQFNIDQEVEWYDINGRIIVENEEKTDKNEQTQDKRKNIC